MVFRFLRRHNLLQKCFFRMSLWVICWKIRIFILGKWHFRRCVFPTIHRNVFCLMEGLWFNEALSVFSESLAATAQLDSLLWNKQFVITLVEITESDYSLSTNDRALFASLLTASLLRNMNYFTDIVITLLTYHTEKCIKVKPLPFFLNPSRNFFFISKKCLLVKW